MIQTPESVTVAADNTTVTFRIRGHMARMTWQTALNVGQKIRIAGKLARNTAGDKDHWTTIAGEEALSNAQEVLRRHAQQAADHTQKVLANGLLAWFKDFRRAVTLRQPSQDSKKIRVGADGESVVLSLGNTDIRFHYTDAIRLSTMFISQGTVAKRNAGVFYKEYSSMGTLSARR